MARIIDLGSAAKDDPIYSSGLQIHFSPQSTPSSGATLKSPDGDLPPAPTSSEAQSETEADGKRAGALRLAKYKHQNKQLQEQAKPKKS